MHDAIIDVVLDVEEASQGLVPLARRSRHEGFEHKCYQSSNISTLVVEQCMKHL